MVTPEQYAVLSTIKSAVLTPKGVSDSVCQRYGKWLNSNTVIAAAVTSVRGAKLAVSVDGELQITKSGLTAMKEFEEFMANALSDYGASSALSTTL